MKEGADGILLAPANSNSLVDSCEKVRKKKIPVALIDSSINSTEFDVCYMTDNIDAGATGRISTAGCAESSL